MEKKNIKREEKRENKIRLLKFANVLIRQEKNYLKE